MSDLISKSMVVSKLAALTALDPNGPDLMQLMNRALEFVPGDSRAKLTDHYVYNMLDRYIRFRKRAIDNAKNRATAKPDSQM